MQPKDIRALQEAWGDITEYQLIPQELSETVESAVEELWEECLSEEDLTEDELEVVLEEAAMGARWSVDHRSPRVLKAPSLAGARR